MKKQTSLQACLLSLCHQTTMDTTGLPQGKDFYPFNRQARRTCPSDLLPVGFHTTQAAAGGGGPAQPRCCFTPPASPVMAKGCPRGEPSTATWGRQTRRQTCGEQNEAIAKPLILRCDRGDAVRAHGRAKVQDGASFW